MDMCDLTSDEDVVWTSDASIAANTRVPKMASLDKKQAQAAAKEMEKARKKREKELAKEKQVEAKLAEKRRRQEKKDEEEFEKKKRRMLQEAQKHAKPGECIKMMTVVLDPSVMRMTCAPAILEALNSSNVRYDVQAQVTEGIVTFWREVTEVIETGNKKLDTERREVVEDEVLMLIPVEQFISLVYNQYQFEEQSDGLTVWYQDKQTSLENRKITLIVQGIEKYFSSSQSKGGKRGGHAAAMKSVTREVSRRQVEEALLALQLTAGGHVRFLESDAEVGQAVLMFTKAIAETPFKRDRLDTGLTVFTGGSASVKVGKDGSGLKQLWRQQLQQLNNVSAEVANAIMAEYPSPRGLYDAYKACPTVRERELLLKDIVVRRGAGVLATTRRVGQELSRKIYVLFTSQDPDAVIK